MKSVIFNCRLCFESNRFVKHAELTRSHKDRQNEPFPTSIAYIQNLRGAWQLHLSQNLDGPNSATKRDIDLKFSQNVYLNHIHK